MNSDNPQEKSTKDSDLTKEELEKEKLLLEIAELRRPWWRKPAHLYTLLAIGSLGVAFVTGQFQANSTRLDTEKAILAYKKEEFELKRDSLHKELEQAVSERENYRAQLNGVTQQLVSTKQELTAVQQQLEFDKIRQTLRSAEPSLFTLALNNAPFSKSLGTLINKPPTKAAPATNNLTRLQLPANPKLGTELSPIQRPFLIPNKLRALSEDLIISNYATNRKKNN